MDEKLLAALISASSGLIGALIGGSVALLTARSATERELLKETLIRAHTLALENLVPCVLIPLLTDYRRAENEALFTGAPPRFPLAAMQELLETKRFIILVAPLPVKHVLDRLEAHICYPDDSERVKLVRQDFKLLEKVIMDVFSSYRLGESRSV